MWQAYLKKMDFRISFILPIYLISVSFFTLLAAYHENWGLFSGLVFFDALLITAFVYLIKKGLTLLGKSIMVMINLAFVTFLIVHGGHEHTGYLWTFPILVSLIHILGAIPGAIMAVLALLFIRILEGEGLSDSVLSSRFYFSALALIFLASVHEYALDRHRQDLSRKVNAKHNESFIDPLTQVGNRRLIDQTLGLLYQRNAGDMVGILVIDLDNFKMVNDTRGHDEGDEVLKMVSKHLSASIRPTDEVARWGGDEFVVFLYDVSLDAAEMVAYRIQQAIMKDTYLELMGISVSIGGALTSTKYRDLFKAADENLLFVKEQGKNDFRIRQIE